MNESDIVKIFSYIVTSARGCIDEPKIYGPLRLLNTMSKLFYILKDNGEISNKEIEKIVEKIDEIKSNCKTDEEKFIIMIDEVIDNLVELVQSSK